MKKILLSFILLLLCAAPVSAHQLEHDGSIGAVMHIDPDDSPIVGQPANFFFDITDRDNHFTMSNCACTVTIQENGKSLYSTALTSASLSSTSFSYSFPQRDVYNIIFEGVPITTNGFQPFSLHYAVRVSREAGAMATPSVAKNIFLGAGLILVLVVVSGALFWEIRRQQSRKSKV